jgi:radical SAM-linked protein
MRYRARIEFRKHGDLRFIGHRDLVRVFERLLRRTGIGLAMSQGFHPKAKLSFPLALSVGIEGAQEIVEVEFSQTIEAGDLLGLLQAECPPGLELLRVAVPAEGTPKPQPASVEYRLPIPGNRQPAANQSVAEFMRKDSYPIQRKGRQKPIDARADIRSLKITDGQLCIVQNITPTASCQPRELLEILELDDLEQQGAWLTRTSIEWASHKHDDLVNTKADSK